MKNKFEHAGVFSPHRPGWQQNQHCEVALQIPNEWATVQGQQTLRSRHQPLTNDRVSNEGANKTGSLVATLRSEPSPSYVSSLSHLFSPPPPPVLATGRQLGSPVRRSLMRGTLVGDCSVVVSAPLTPVAPTMDARFGTPVLMPIPSVAHLSSTSIVEEAAVGPQYSASSSRSLAYFFSDPESGLRRGRYHRTHHSG